MDRPSWAFEYLDEALNTISETRVGARSKPKRASQRGVLPKLSHHDEASQCFQDAQQVARELRAKSFDLRATLSVARLLRDTNRRVEARTMLAEIYAWFTEGFDTADLKEAKALFEELNNSP